MLKNKPKFKTLSIVSFAVLISALMAACSSSPAKVTTIRNGPQPPAVSFVTSQAEAFNGPIPTDNATTVCGRNQYGFIAEIQHVGILDTKITKHYGPMEPLPNGMPKQMEASGTMVDGSGGNVDLPFDHSFGGDFSMDVAVQKPYLKLHQKLGAIEGVPPGQVHMEIQMGEMPHFSSDPTVKKLPANISWPDYATNAESSILPGFIPQKGDATAIEGDWITDCGHPDFHSELHEMTFMAFGHDQNNASVVHTFYNPYLPSELFNPNPALASEINNPKNMTLSSTVPLVPNYLVNKVVNIVQTKSTAPISVPMLVAPSNVAPSPFTVCAPNKGTGHNFALSYNFVTRPGVQITDTVNNSSGCATFTVKFTKSFKNVPPQGETQCPVSWSWLNQNAAGYAVGGTINLQSTILNDASQVFPSSKTLFSKVLTQDMRVDCYDLLGTSLTPTVGSGQSITTSSTQILPFAGWIKAEWN
jgi:hypothetical protein